jgi:hypothetical protein
MNRADRVYADKPGLYAITLAKNAPEVGCLVAYGPPIDPLTGETLDRSYRWSVWINGKEVHNSPAQYDRLLIGRVITEAYYRWLLADRAWARQHAPDSPEANPRQRVEKPTKTPAPAMAPKLDPRRVAPIY